MPTLRMIALTALLVFASSNAYADVWRTYHNTRFGATADVPAEWLPQPPPANGDGLIFDSPDKRATVTISGILAMGAVAEGIAERAAAGEGERVTYSKAGLNMVAVSGLKDGDKVIFYRRSLASCNGTIWNSVVIEYPADDKARYDGLVARVSGSLRAGDGWMCKRR